MNRSFSVAAGRPPLVRAVGSTTSLLKTVEVAGAWLAGATLTQLSARFPFMSYRRLALAFEQGNHLEMAWELILHDADLADLQPLVRAAHTDPRLAQRLVLASHNVTLRLERDAFDWTTGHVFIHRAAEHSYWVVASWDGDGSREVGTVAEAVDLAGRLMTVPVVSPDCHPLYRAVHRC